MTDYEKVFFSILRSALWGSVVEVPKGFNQWNIIMRLARAQAIGGLVSAVMLTRSEIRSSLPPKSVEKLQSVPMTNIGMYSQMNIALQLLILTLRNGGIEPVLLKGQGLAHHYPNPELRQCGDIDIYVGHENYEKAYELIAPIASRIEDRKDIWQMKHFDALVGSVIVEVHHKTDVMASRINDKIYQKFMSEGLSKNLSSIQVGDVKIMTPNDTYNAFYIFYHLWRHFSTSGVGLRQFSDMAGFLHARVGKLDLSCLKKMLDDLGFMKPWQVFGCFIVKDLGLPAEEFPFYNEKYLSKVDRVREYVMTDGNFGVNIWAGQEKRRGYLHGKWITLKYYALRFFRMYFLFPKHTLFSSYYLLKHGFTQFYKDWFKKN